LHLSLFQ